MKGTYETDEGDVVEVYRCPQCGGLPKDGYPGFLFHWFRCRNCGWDWREVVEDEYSK
jgi:rubredoxin